MSDVRCAMSDVRCQDGDVDLWIFTSDIVHHTSYIPNSLSP
jgi:hypothetical protein